jgi:hypothetical protein
MSKIAAIKFAAASCGVLNVGEGLSDTRLAKNGSIWIEAQMETPSEASVGALDPKRVKGEMELVKCEQAQSAIF